MEAHQPLYVCLPNPGRPCRQCGWDDDDDDDDNDDDDDYHLLHLNRSAGRIASEVRATLAFNTLRKLSSPTVEECRTCTAPSNS